MLPTQSTKPVDHSHTVSAPGVAGRVVRAAVYPTAGEVMRILTVVVHAVIVAVLYLAGLVAITWLVHFDAALFAALIAPGLYLLAVTAQKGQAK